MTAMVATASPSAAEVSACEIRAPFTEKPSFPIAIFKHSALGAIAEGAFY